MDFEQMERAWTGPGNRPDAARETKMIEMMMHRLRSRRRRLALFVAGVGLALTAWTGAILYGLASRGGFDPGREWGAVALLVLPWAALAVVESWRRRQLTAHPDPYGSAPATLKALIDENGAARRRVKFMAVMVALGVGAIAVALVQTQAAGRMRPQDMVFAALVMGLALAAVWAGVAIRYFGALKPEAARLRGLLADYEAG